MYRPHCGLVHGCKENRSMLQTNAPVIVKPGILIMGMHRTLNVIITLVLAKIKPTLVK